MGIGGQLDRRPPAIGARLIRAYTGVTRFEFNQWVHPRSEGWVLDCINHGQQRQRIGNDPEFVRFSGMAALYAPECEYHEYTEAGASLDESYIIFNVWGKTKDGFRRLVGRPGWCHVQDPQRLLGDLLQRLGEALFSRAANFHILVHGLFCELLANVLSSDHLAPRLRRAWKEVPVTGRDQLRARTEQFIRSHITKSLRVADLARNVNMSLSTFAHVYPDRVGEAPHQTVLRLKMETAKRLLLDDRLSVKEVANRLGFSSEFHFSHAFKRLEGLAPRHYLIAMTRKRIWHAPSERFNTRAIHIVRQRS